MATITLPHPNIDFVPLDILTAAEQNQLVANINALASFVNEIGNSYPTTSESDIGKWIDGKTIYRKVVSCGQLPNSANKATNHGVSNIDKIINICGTARSADGNTISIPFVHENQSITGVKVTVDRVKVNIATSRDWSSFTECYVIIEYTKN